MEVIRKEIIIPDNGKRSIGSANCEVDYRENGDLYISTDGSKSKVTTIPHSSWSLSVEIDFSGQIIEIKSDSDDEDMNRGIHIQSLRNGEDPTSLFRNFMGRKVLNGDERDNISGYKIIIPVGMEMVIINVEINNTTENEGEEDSETQRQELNTQSSLEDEKSIGVPLENLKLELAKARTDGQAADIIDKYQKDQDMYVGEGITLSDVKEYLNFGGKFVNNAINELPDDSPLTSILTTLRIKQLIDEKCESLDQIESEIKRSEIDNSQSLFDQRGLNMTVGDLLFMINSTDSETISESEIPETCGLSDVIISFSSNLEDSSSKEDQGTNDIQSIDSTSRNSRSDNQYENEDSNKVEDFDLDDLISDMLDPRKHDATSPSTVIARREAEVHQEKYSTDNSDVWISEKDDEKLEDLISRLSNLRQSDISDYENIDEELSQALRTIYIKDKILQNRNATVFNSIHTEKKLLVPHTDIEGNHNTIQAGTVEHVVEKKISKSDDTTEEDYIILPEDCGIRKTVRDIDHTVGMF